MKIFHRSTELCANMQMSMLQCHLISLLVPDFLSKDVIALSNVSWKIYIPSPNQTIFVQSYKNNELIICQSHNFLFGTCSKNDLPF